MWPPVLRHTGLLVRRVLLRKQIIPRKYWRGTSNTRPACVVFVYSYATKIGEGKKRKETYNTHFHTDTLNPAADCFIIASTDILNTGQESVFPHVSCVSWGWVEQRRNGKEKWLILLPSHFSWDPDRWEYDTKGAAIPPARPTGFRSQDDLNQAREVTERMYGLLSMEKLLVKINETKQNRPQSWQSSTLLCKIIIIYIYNILWFWAKQYCILSHLLNFQSLRSHPPAWVLLF